MDLKRHIDTSVHAGFALKGDKAESTRPAGVLIHHQCGVDYSTKLGKVLSELLVGGVLAHSSHKDLARLFLLVTRNSSFGINLWSVSNYTLPSKKKKTYNLAIQKMFLDHDNVDCLRVLEGQEAKATGPPRAAVSHYSALDDFSEL